MTRYQFPDGFIWGAATSAQQIEGGRHEGGRGESIWDRFAATPGKIEDGSNADIACDHYHRWREDIGLMTRLSLDSYRFSIAWPRILPTGSGAPNPDGLDFYDALVDGLRAHGHRLVLPFANPADLAELINGFATPGDLVVCLGAGSITAWAAVLPKQLATLRSGAEAGK